MITHLKTRNGLAERQYVINLGKYLIFQSYETVIAIYDRQIKTIYVDNGKYSRTTSKYLNHFTDTYCSSNCSGIGFHQSTLRDKLEEILYKLWKED